MTGFTCRPVTGGAGAAAVQRMVAGGAALRQAKVCRPETCWTVPVSLRGHRPPGGERGSDPENTARRPSAAAVALGADWVELDVRADRRRRPGGAPRRRASPTGGHRRADPAPTCPRRRRAWPRPRGLRRPGASTSRSRPTAAGAGGRPRRAGRSRWCAAWGGEGLVSSFDAATVDAVPAARPDAAHRPAHVPARPARRRTLVAWIAERGHVAWHPHHAMLDAEPSPPPTTPAWRSTSGPSTTPTASPSWRVGRRRHRHQRRPATALGGALRR